MNDILGTLQARLAGRCTYLTSLLAAALLFGSWQGWWRIPPEFGSMLSALATVLLRAALTREVEALRERSGTAPKPPPPAGDWRPSGTDPGKEDAAGPPAR